MNRDRRGTYDCGDVLPIDAPGSRGGINSSTPIGNSCGSESKLRLRFNISSALLGSSR